MSSTAEASNANDDSDSTVVQRLKQEFGIDPDNRECKCSDTNVTHVKVIDNAGGYYVHYKCDECANGHVGPTANLIPVEYARARQTTIAGRSFITVYDERARMNGAEYAQ